MPNAELHTISSPHGHDSFLIEIQALNRACVEWRDRALGAAAGQAGSAELALLQHTQWSVGSTALKKTFTFQTERALSTFKLRLADLVLAGRRAGGSPAVDAGSCAVAVELGRHEVDAAMGIDALAAELQLAGKWS